MLHPAIILMPAAIAITLAIGCRIIPTETRRADTTKTADNVASNIALQFKETVRGQDRNAVSNGGTIPPQVLVMSSPVHTPQPLTITGSSNVTVRLDPAPAAPVLRAVATSAGHSTAADTYYRETEASATAGVEATSNSDAHTETATSIPLGVKLALIGIGIAAIVGALAMAWKHIRTTALGQGIAAADAVLANRIRSARAKATTSRDPDEINKALAEVADLESERGRLKP